MLHHQPAGCAALIATLPGDDQHHREPACRSAHPNPPHHKLDRKSTRLNSSHLGISYAVFCLKKIYSCELSTPARNRTTMAAPKSPAAMAMARPSANQIFLKNVATNPVPPIPPRNAFRV